ncbi:MAG: hypothetical protein HY602_03150 [Parcubacteria group bacterium]|nr:hypothetical protein [Parcubacteria group bacterium]
MGIKITNGCEGGGNLVKAVTIYSPQRKAQKIILPNSHRTKTVMFKEPFSGPGLIFTLTDFYKNKKLDDTCISDLQFITRELADWPKPTRTLLETHPEFVRRPQNLIFNRPFDLPDLLDVYSDGMKVGEIRKSFPLRISTSGWNFSNSSKPFLIHLSQIKKMIDVSYSNVSPFFDGDSPRLQKNDRYMYLIGWFPNDQLCLAIHSETGDKRFLVYQIEGQKLRFKRNSMVSVREVEERSSATSGMTKFSSLNFFQRSFCPIK